MVTSYHKTIDHCALAKADVFTVLLSSWTCVHAKSKRSRLYLVDTVTEPFQR
jgi:hypothetical protein